MSERSTLQTTRLTLEPILAGHAELIFPGLSDPRLYDFIPQQPPVSVEALRARYLKLEPGRSPDGHEKWLNWAVRRRDDGSAIGLGEATVGPDLRARIAYFVFTAFARRGFGVEAMGAVVRHLFGDLEVTLVAAEIDARNWPSQHLVERLGFRRAAFVAGADEFKGAVSDEWRYELGAEAWRAQQVQ